MDLYSLSRQLERALSAEMYDKAREIIEQIKQKKDYSDPSNKYIGTLIIRNEVKQAEEFLNNLQEI